MSLFGKLEEDARGRLPSDCTKVWRTKKIPT